MKKSLYVVVFSIICVVLCFLGCAGVSSKSIEKSIPEPQQQKSSSVDYDNILESIENGEDISEMFGETASARPDNVEIVWDKITYYISCPFFKSNVLFNLKAFSLENPNSPIGIDQHKYPYYYGFTHSIDTEIDRYKVYTDKFNEMILDCSNPDIEKGEIQDESATIVREEIANTVKSTCYKFTFEFDKSMFKSTNIMTSNEKKLFEEGIGIMQKYNKENVDRVLEEFNNYKNNYNVGKVEGYPSTCKD